MQRARNVLAGSLLILLFAPFFFGQLGEVAGGLNYNISIGSSNSLPMTIINTGTVPLQWGSVNPTFKAIPNATSPIVIINPSNGTLSPHEQEVINVTVELPVKGNKPGYMWQGLLQILATSSPNATVAQNGGVQLQEGVGKVVTVYASKQKFSIVPYAIVAVVVIVAIALVAFYKMKGAKKTKSAASSKKLSSSKRRKGARKSRKAPKRTRRKTAATRRRRRR